MLQTTEAPWTESETQCAHTLLQKAYEREVSNLLEDVQAQVSDITKVDELWKLHDFLSAKRHEIDGKYDGRESVIVFVFAQLLKERLIDAEELAFLAGEKRAKIKALARL
ncbi:MAG: hypothetical protein VKJ27_03865 [Synechocystis sp.]|nr:hypothetical protein [Synechocystis sp.]